MALISWPSRPAASSAIALTFLSPMQGSRKRRPSRKRRSRISISSSQSTSALPYFLVQQLIPVLSEGSSVILVSSLGAHAAVGTLSAYAATKGAIDTLVKYFATALG